MKLKVTVIASLAMLVVASSAVALVKPIQTSAHSVDAQVETLAIHIEGLAPKVSSLDRPL